jgi:hypothetical protein
MYECLTNKFGAIGYCERDDYHVLLDNYGFSLKKIAATTPASISRAQTFLSQLILDSVKETISKVRFDNMEIGKVVSSYNVATLTDTDRTIGLQELEFTTECEATAFYLDSFNIHGTGNIAVTLIYDQDVEEILYSGEVNRHHFVKVNKLIPYGDFKLKIDGGEGGFEAKEVDLSNCDCSIYQFEVSEVISYGVEPFVSLRCDLSRYWCQFADLIADVAKFRLFAKLLHAIKYSDRLNDYILFKDNDKIYELMAFYDSEYNMSAINGDNQILREGQYQKALNTLGEQIPAPACTCCQKICKDKISFSITNL